MLGVVVWLRAAYRRSWRAWLSLAVIFGIFAGAAIAAAAGARRTESAYPRFVRAQDGFDALTGGGAEADFEAHHEAIKHLPEVKDTTDLILVGGRVTIPAHRGFPERSIGAPEAFVIADPTGSFLYKTNRSKVLEGRLPIQSHPNETVVAFSIADRYRIRLGDSIIAGVGFDDEGAPVRNVSLEVVGIEAAPGEFDAVGQTSIASVYATPALYEEIKDLVPPLIPDLSTTGVHLRDGPTAAAAFKRHVERTLNIDVPFIAPVITSAVQKSLRLYAAALWILAALVGIGAIAVFGQALARQIMLDAADYPALRALGIGRRHLTAAGLLRGAIIGAGAIPVAAAVAYLGSWLTPIGPARIAEPSPGFAFDATAVLAGLAFLFGSVVLLSVIPSLRAAHLASATGGGADAPMTTSRVVAGAARVTVSPAAVTGLRMALEPGRGRNAVPVRSTIAAVAIGVAAVTAALVVGESMRYLIDTPSLTGYTYDAIVPNESAQTNQQRYDRLTSFPFVEAASEGTGVNISVGKVDSFLVGFDPEGSIGFAIINGRAPTNELTRGIPEVALGPATMRRMHLKIGDVVSFDYATSDDRAKHTAKARIVGSAAIPALPWAATDPGEGAMMTIKGIQTFAPDSGGGGCCYVRFKPGTKLDVARATLDAAGLQTFVRADRADLRSLERIAAVPVALSAIFGAMAFAALVHVLVTGIRRRRRDLAILKTLGFVKRQVRGAIAWQATTITVICVVVGIPAGIVLGRWGWDAIAGIFGVVPIAKAPVLNMALAVPVAVAIANLVALLPGRSAARTEPAVTLRSE